MKRSSAAFVLASGGLDSAVLLDYASRRHKKVFPLYVRFGLSWELAEFSGLKKYLRAVHRPELRNPRVLRHPVDDLYGRHWSRTGRNVPGYRSRDERVYLPGRNILLLAQAGTLCALEKVPHLYIGILGSNPFPDGSVTFLRRMEAALRRGLHFPLKIHAPFAGLSKRDVLRMGKGLPLERTFSCLAPKGSRHCGRCNKCAERDRALRDRQNLL
jgi:7-cyano-7-deazaguanine synthase